MTLMSSLVIFQALEPLQPQWPLQPLQPPWPQWPIQPHFIKKITDIDDWIIPSTTMTNTYCGIDIRKSHFTVISGTLSVGGCWGQPMLVFWKLVEESQISKPQKYTNTFKLNLTFIFLSVRVNLKETFQCETPCCS